MEASYLQPNSPKFISAMIELYTKTNEYRKLLDITVTKFKESKKESTKIEAVNKIMELLTEIKDINLFHKYYDTLFLVELDDIPAINNMMVRICI